MTIEIGHAVAEDAAFVAWTVMTALDMTLDEGMNVVDCCRDEKSMYSWQNSLIAKVDGKCTGCIIAYDGAEYMRLREYTWSKLWDDFDSEYVKNIAQETESGEYYLDSMAILPEYRGHDIGKLLIHKAIERGNKLGFKRFGLIVDKKKPHLFDYYQTLGFVAVGEMEFFGHFYSRMQLNED